MNKQQHDYEVEKVYAIRHFTKCVNGCPKQHAAEPLRIQTKHEQACRPCCRQPIRGVK
jgi:hypothetical protein